MEIFALYVFGSILLSSPALAFWLIIVSLTE